MAAEPMISWIGLIVVGGIGILAIAAIVGVVLMLVVGKKDRQAP
jgi:hypothetical protein